MEETGSTALDDLYAPFTRENQVAAQKVTYVKDRKLVCFSCNPEPGHSLAAVSQRHCRYGPRVLKGGVVFLDTQSQYG